MNTDFQKILKQLGKQAKKEAAEKQESEKNKQKQEHDLDFSQAVGQVSPLKKPAAILCAVRQNPHQSPSQRQPHRRRKLLLHRQHIQRPTRQLLQKRTGKKRHPTPEKRILSRRYRCRPARLHPRRSTKSPQRIHRIHPKTRRMRRNHPRQRIRFQRLQTRSEKHDPKLADATPRRTRLRRTPGRQRRLRPHPAQTQIKAARLTNFSDRLGSTAQYPYNLQTISGGDLGFDGGCEADAGIPGSQIPVKH